MAVEESWISFEGKDREIEGYLALPGGGESGLPGVIVIHEIWGLDEHIKDVARRLAAEGYVALAPDLYTGEWREVMSEERIMAGITFMRSASQEIQRDPEKLESALSAKPQEERDATKMLMSVMSPNQRQSFARDLLGSLAYLQERPEVDEEKIGSLGFCMGGAISGILATLSPELRASVIFYGQNPPLEHVPDIHASVLGLYGGDDPRITDNVPEFLEAMEKAGKNFSYHVYPDAPHAFFNDTRPNYRSEAARDAWERVLAFFEDTLKSATRM
ncbi:MAG: carboxymethylenebutenolidase [Rubrobacteraceae bacterium]|nr:carboxymethylenebutenolidase [Rubrobacteraceae bacterium]